MKNCAETERLFSAIKNGEVELTASLLNKSPQLLRSINQKKQSPLLFAVMCDNINIVEVILEKGGLIRTARGDASIHLGSYHFHNPFSGISQAQMTCYAGAFKYAVMKNKHASINFLFNNFSAINNKLYLLWTENFTALFWAVRQGNQTLVNFFLENADDTLKQEAFLFDSAILLRRYVVCSHHEIMRMIYAHAARLFGFSEILEMRSYELMTLLITHNDSYALRIFMSYAQDFTNEQNESNLKISCTKMLQYQDFSAFHNAIERAINSQSADNPMGKKHAEQIVAILLDSAVICGIAEDMLSSRDFYGWRSAIASNQLEILKILMLCAYNFDFIYWQMCLSIDRKCFIRLLSEKDSNINKMYLSQMERLLTIVEKKLKIKTVHNAVQLGDHPESDMVHFGTEMLKAQWADLKKLYADQIDTPEKQEGILNHLRIKLRYAYQAAPAQVVTSNNVKVTIPFDWDCLRRCITHLSDLTRHDFHQIRQAYLKHPVLTVHRYLLPENHGSVSESISREMICCFKNTLCLAWLVLSDPNMLELKDSSVEDLCEQFMRQLTDISSFGADSHNSKEIIGFTAMPFCLSASLFRHPIFFAIEQCISNRLISYFKQKSQSTNRDELLQALIRYNQSHCVDALKTLQVLDPTENELYQMTKEIIEQLYIDIEKYSNFLNYMKTIYLEADVFKKISYSHIIGSYVIQFQKMIDFTQILKNPPEILQSQNDALLFSNHAPEKHAVRSLFFVNPDACELVSIENNSHKSAMEI